MRVNTQDIVAHEAGMDVYVQVWNFLESRLSNGVPETQALIWKSTTNCPRDARYHRHECGASCVIKLANVVKMLPRNNQRVARVELP